MSGIAADNQRLAPSVRTPVRVLFTGYAHVHFLCFEPLYRRFAGRQNFELYLSGGLRSTTDAGVMHDHDAMYAPFDVAQEHVRPVEALQDLDVDLLFAANTKMIEPRSVSTRIQIFHGISFRNRAVRAENAGCDHYFMVGPFMHRRFVEGGLLEADDPRAVPAGFMKTDRLLNGELDRETIRAGLNIDGRRPVLLFAPTGQKHNSLETMGEQIIEALNRADRYDLLIKLHDHPKNLIDWPRRLAPLLGPHCRIVREPDIIPLLLAADVLISDASSVTNEFALLDRPMIFLDVPKLLARAAGRKDSMLDLDTWGRRTGLLVERPEQIIDAVEQSLLHPDAHGDIRSAMVRDLFYNRGCATDFALNWLEQRGLIPASASAGTVVPSVVAR